MPIAFSQDWARAWCDALNRSEVYREVAASWEGSVALVAIEGPTGIREAVWLDLWHGACRGARVASPTDLEDADYVLQAKAAAWRTVFRGRIAPLMALMTGQVQLTRGNFADLVPHAGSARELLQVVAQVSTEFPPGW